MHNRGLGSWPARRARMTPDRTAVVYEAVGDAAVGYGAVGRAGAGDQGTASPQVIELSYRELADRVARLASVLRGVGVRPGDRVAYLGPNHPSLLETLFAAGSVGAVFVPINFRLTAPEIEYVLADSGATMVIHGPTQAEVLGAVGSSVGGRRLDLAEYASLLAGAEPDAGDEPVGFDDPGVILYTSGSTGRPKGAVLTHGNLTWNCTNVLVETDLAGDEVTLVVAPLFHAAALGMICLPTLLKGGTVVLHGAFDPGRVLADIRRRRVTLMFGVPTMYQAIAEHPDWAGADLSSVRNLSCGGAPVPLDIIQRYLARGLVFVQGYGMTEAAPGVLFLDRAHVTSKAGSAGVPSFFTDVRVVGPDSTPVAPGEKGEVVVSGPNVMPGYWGRPQETADVLRDGWFQSGDVATVDVDGYVYIVDRLKDVIISGGENVYPAEVESALYEHPAVVLCAVIGVPDDRWGEVGRAIVVLRPGQAATEDELRAFLRERLAGYKVPKYVEFVAELPVTGSGKILKGRLRERYGNPPG